MDATDIAALNGLYAAVDRMAAEPIDLRHAVSAGIGVSLNGGLCVSVNIEADGRPGTVWRAYRCDSGVHAEGSSAQERLSRGWRPARRTSTPPGARSWPAGST